MKFERINTGNDNTSYWVEVETFQNLGTPKRVTRKVRVDQIDYESTDPRSGMYTKRWEIKVGGRRPILAKTRAAAVAELVAMHERYFAEYGV